MKIPFWSQTHRNRVVHQIQSVDERARRRREKPELRRSPNQRQIKPSRHKSPAQPPLNHSSRFLEQNRTTRAKKNCRFFSLSSLGFLSSGFRAKRKENCEKYG